ncbi:MAG: hypothetical protein KDB53_17075, partial [Planctomycetes bacterium]|nr:hypothetical protein [Planctomycetota bacterium]
MVFSSYVFLFNFLAFVLAAYHLLAVVREPAARNRFRLALLLVASLWFYGWHRFDYIGLVLFSTLIDWQCGARIARAAPGARGRRGWLLVSVVVNLSLLGFFKYFDFGVE